MKYPNRDELIAKAKELREGGLSYRAIASALGVKAHITIIHWLNPAVRANKARYREENKDKVREQDRINSARWYNENKDRARKTQEAYRLTHKDELSALNKKYRAGHKDELKTKRSLYYAENKDEICANSLAYYYEHKDECDTRSRHWFSEHKNDPGLLAKRKEYQERNKGKIRIRKKEYNKVHKQEILERNRKRKTLIKTGDTIIEDQYSAVWEEQNGCCFYCGEPMIRDGNCYADNYYNVEHINPISNGGWHQLSNIVYACRKCNSKKGKKLVEVWMPGIINKIRSNPRLNYNIEEAHMRWLV